MVRGTALPDGRNGNDIGELPLLSERMFVLRWLAATRVPRRLLATVPGRGHPDYSEVT